MPAGIGYPPATGSGFMSQARRMNPSFQNPAAAPIDQQDILPTNISLPDTIAAASGAPATPGPFDTVPPALPPKPSIKPPPPGPQNMPAVPPIVAPPINAPVAMMAGQNVGRDMSAMPPMDGETNLVNNITPANLEQIQDLDGADISNEERRAKMIIGGIPPEVVDLILQTGNTNF